MSNRDPRVSRLVTELQASSDRMTPERRKYLHSVVAGDFPPDVSQLIEELTPMPSGVVARQIVENLREAIRTGFVLALARYHRELKSNKEAASILANRTVGLDRGRNTQQRKKADRIGRIQSMFNSGMEPSAIAAKEPCSIATVYRALKPATSKPRKPSKRSRKR